MNKDHQKTLAYFMYTLLVTIFGTLVFTVYAQNTAFWSDEIIALEVSKQNISVMLDTIHSEPHPIGFYLVLKIVDITQPILTRISIISISFFLLVCALIWAERKNLLGPTRLYIGVILFIASFCWINSATNIKQDFITVPLFIISFFMTLEYVNSKRTSTLVSLGLLTLSMLFFGYLNFVKSLLLLAVATVTTKSKHALITLTLLLLVFAVYIYSLGFIQATENIARFRFVIGSTITPISLLIQGIGGPINVKNNYYLPDFIFLGVVFLVYKFSLSKKTSSEKFIFRLLFVFAVFDILFAPLIRIRYMFELIFLILLIAGIEIHKLFYEQKQQYLKLICYLLFTLVVFSNLINFYLVNQAILISEQVNIGINKLVLQKDYPTGIIERHPDGAFIRKIWYFPENNLATPVDPFVSDQEAYSHITRKLLNKEGAASDIDSATLIENLKKKNITRFIYLDTTPKDNNTFYYDPEHKTPTVLSTYCADKELIYEFGRLIVLFDKCDFTRPLGTTDFLANPQ